jgi:hypothetical protein
MKQNKLLYNNLLRMFNKCKRRLANLIATGRNSNRQTVLQKHIERLYAKIMNLQANIQRGTVVASVALAAMAFNSNEAQAQTFGPVQTNPFSLTISGNNSSPTFADLDNDGDLDMLSGEGGGAFKYFKNIGTATTPSYSTAVSNPFGLAVLPSNYTTPVFVDIDNDGDMDILSGSSGGAFFYFQNTGTVSAPMYAAMASNPFGLTSGYYSCPTFADLDNDGDMDMLSGDYNGNFYYYQNTGTASAPAFAAVALNPFGLMATGGYSHPTFIDMDSDGDKDMMSGDSNGNFRYYQNTGTAAAPAFAAQTLNPFFLAKVTGKSTPVFVDLDNNGDKELMSGVGSGSDNGMFKYYKQVIPGPAAALNFDGNNDHVNIGTLLNTTLSSSNKITVEAWVKPTTNGYLGCIVGNYNTPPSNSGMQFLLRRDGANYTFWVDNGTGFTNVTSAATTTLGAWQHVAGTWDGVTMNIYVNGILSGTTSCVGTSFASSLNETWIGNNTAGTPESYTGDIDEIRIWNVARSQCEINDYKNCEIPTTASGLVANYHFNQGMSPAINTTVTTLTDASVSAYTGTLTNMGLTGATSNWTAPGGVVSGYTVSGSVGIAASNSVICMGNSTTLSVTGADTYTWSGGVTNGAAFSPTTTASYTVVGTVTLTGCTNTVVSTVTVNALPTVSVTSGAICAGKSFTMVPSGAATYTISGGSAIVTPTTNTSYNVTGTSAQGCASSNTAVSTVTVNALPTVSATTSSSLLCTGNTASLTATGATSYTWSTSSTSSVVAVSPTVTTTYTVTGINANGCSNITTVTQNVSTCAGLEMLTSTSSNMFIYPNPSNGSFTIELASDANVSISNALGQVVMSTSMIAGTHTIVLSDVTDGIYFVKVITGNTQTIKRLVVSK